LKKNYLSKGQKKKKMPIYMDIHNVPGVKAKNVAEAHQKDLIHQDEFGCKSMTYWIDEERENVFCLIDAPNKAAVREMHRRAHGLSPHKIIEVDSSLVTPATNAAIMTKSISMRLPQLIPSLS
jgi:hypothetical protein